jgi:tRNA threonylcarbamoyladenosine biosynthesis protein TsaB
MALLLSLETSTHEFSCALHDDQKLIAFNKSLTEQTTASMLAAKVDGIFSSSGLPKSQLSAVVVAAGPGSYTGLRIGAATAKGICYALDIPLISVNTLALMTRQFIDQFSFDGQLKSALLCPMLDARRMEVYCMISHADGLVSEPIQAKIIDEKSFINYLEKQPIYFFGEGSDKCKNLIHHPNSKFVSGLKPSASFLGVIGHERYLRGEFENPDQFEPLYLKDFIIKKPNLVS